MNERDRDMFQWVRVFKPYILYTNHDVGPDLDLVMLYYRDLASKYFRETLQW